MGTCPHALAILPRWLPTLRIAVNHHPRICQLSKPYHQHHHFPKVKPKVSARQLRKFQRAEELQEVLQTFAEQDIPLVYTDGSSAVEEGVGRLAGYGVCCADRGSVAAYVPSDMRQTQNTAEVLAVLRALQIFTSEEIAICTHSQYVVLCAAGAARH